MQQRTFEKITRVIVNAPKMAYCELVKPMRVTNDMPDVGEHLALLQNGKPVSYPSRFWNDYERSYTLYNLGITEIQGLPLQKTSDKRDRSQTV